MDASQRYVVSAYRSHNEENVALTRCVQLFHLRAKKTYLLAAMLTITSESPLDMDLVDQLQS